MKRTFIFLVCLSVSACAQQRPESIIVVPSASTTTAEYRGDGSVPRQRYVVRMSDGKRDWEVEFPEVATGYQVRIPLKGETGSNGMVWESDNLTDADKELLKQLRRDNPGMEREGVFKNGKNINDPEGKNEVGGLDPGAELDENGRTVKRPGKVSPQGDESGAAQTRPSYLLGIQEVQRLFKSGNYELAMVRITQLENAYPNDVKLLSMKGTLWKRLGKTNLARDTWERVLQIEPDNRAVAEALKQLK